MSSFPERYRNKQESTNKDAPTHTPLHAHTDAHKNNCKNTRNNTHTYKITNTQKHTRTHTRSHLGIMSLMKIIVGHTVASARDTSLPARNGPSGHASSSNTTS